MKGDKALREDVLHLLTHRNAHIEFKRAVAGLGPALRGKKPEGAPYTPWQQVEHIRLSQRDILEYIRNPHYVQPDWPDDYWPAAAPPTGRAWHDSIRGFLADRRALARLVADPRTDLLARVPYDKRGPSILHEVLLIAAHTSYHLGQLIVLRRLLGAWRD